MGYKTISTELISDKVIDQRLKEHLETMNNLTVMKIACDKYSVSSIYLCFMHKNFWMGVLNHFALTVRIEFSKSSMDNFHFCHRKSINPAILSS